MVKLFQCAYNNFRDIMSKFRQYRDKNDYRDSLVAIIVM